MMKPGMLAPWVMALLSTVGIAFVGLANASPLAVAQQERVNQDANAFKLSSMVSAELFAAGTAPARDAVDADAPHGMGALPITEERLAKEKKEGRGIKKIRLNKIGLARVNAERAKKGQSALVAGVDLQVAPIGMEVETEADAGGSVLMTEDREASGAEGVTDAGGATDEFATDGESGGALPSAVNNSTLKYFPPIRNQGQVNSCVGWCEIYYNMTHETALQYDRDVKAIGDDAIFSPLFTYNFLNGGLNDGTYFGDHYTIAQKHGAVRWTEMTPTSSFTRNWDTTAAHYRRAIDSRIDGYGYLSSLNTSNGLALLKTHLANGRIASYRTDFDGWGYKTLSNDPNTTGDDSEAGKWSVYSYTSTSSGHGMTVVGYNDEIWCDINGNSVVDANEKGGLLVVNSYGTTWKSGGYCWVPYSILQTTTIFSSTRVYIATIKPVQHAPSVVARITLNHNNRSQVSATVGSSATNKTTPTQTAVSEIVQGQGGAYAFSGAAAAYQDFTYYIDMTDLAPSIGTAQRWYVTISDWGTGDVNLTLKAFDLIYISSGVDRPVGSCSTVPVVANGVTQYAYIDWTMGDILPAVTVTSVVASASEEGPATGSWTITRDGSTAALLAVHYSLSGTATQGVDYTISPASPLTIPAGQTSATVTLTPIDETVADEGTESAVLTVQPNAAYYVAAAAATVTIADNDLVAPAVSNQSWTATGPTSADLSGVIVTGAQASVWICWGAVDAGTATTGSWTKVQYVGNFSKGVPFTAVVTGMGTNTTYWYRFYLSNAAGIGWSGAAAMFNGSPVKTNGEWSPSNLVAVAWYDASDSNSLTLVSGKVSQWGDKSGNNRHAAQGTTGSQPTYRAADTRMNNLPSIGYDNAYRWLRTPVMAFSNVYVVTYYDAATFNNWMPLLGDGVDQGHEMRGYNGRLELNTGRGFAFYRDGATTTTAACPQVATLWRAAATTNLGNYAWFVLGGPATWQYWNYGAVSELIFTDGTEGLPVQQMIEGYMAHKWQIDGNLPADHPYKNHPPGGGESVAVANLAPTAIADSAATLNANISTHSTNADVYVHWGLSDGGTNANGWMSSVKVETYTNVTTNLFYTATGLNPGQTYYYTFRATNETTNLWASPSWSFRTSGQTSILAPSNLSATPGSGLINLTWTDTSTNETGFRVERSLSGMSGFTAIGGATANATNYTDSAVSPGPIYYYRIAATNVTESSVVSGTASASLPKLSATVTISNTNQVYDGTPRSVSYATVPAELAADITYGGSPSTPVDAGTYTVVVTINDATYEGAATGTLVVAKVTPTVTAWPTAASIVEGQSLFYSELTGGNASVPGTFGFDTPSYPPPRGINPVDVTFEADDAVNYFSVGGTVDVVVAEYHQDPPLINHQGWTTNGTTGANLSSVLVAGDSASIWVCWGALDGGTASVGNWDHVDAVGNFGEGEPFTAHVTGLATNTTYWYRFYGTNAAGTCWSDTAIAFNGSPVGTDEPWTPVEMATAAWYDAADTNTLWADTTGLTKATTKVARWDDKSGYNRHVTQTNSTQQPSYASSIITFDGTTNMLFNSSPFAYAMGAVDVYVVAAVNTNSGMRIVSENWTSTDNTLYTPAQTRTGSGTAMSAYVRNDTGSTNATGIRFEGTNALSATGSFNRTTPNLYHWRDAATNFAGRVAGGSPTTVSYTRLGTVTVDRFAIGAIGPRPSSPNGSAFVNAGLREIVITGILSDSDRQKMEGYLAHKWTLAGNLPSGHPYKTQPPGSGAVTVENLAPAAILGSTATLNAVVSALSTNVDAYVHWGLSDGGTNAGSWTHSAKVGSYTNASANVGYPAEGLSSGQTYYYTFSISNASAHVWASPSWTFRTPGTGGSCLLTVSSPYGFPNPSGATPHSLGSSIDAVLSGSPVVTGQTQYVCTGWTATGSGLTSGPGTNVSFTITTDTTITWQWTTNYWVELFIHGE